MRVITIHENSLYVNFHLEDKTVIVIPTLLWQAFINAIQFGISLAQPSVGYTLTTEMCLEQFKSFYKIQTADEDFQSWIPEQFGYKIY